MLHHKVNSFGQKKEQVDRICDPGNLERSRRCGFSIATDHPHDQRWPVSLPWRQQV